MGGASLFVRGLHRRATEDELSAHFAAVAPVRHAVVCTGSDGACRGFGFVAFAHADDATRAVRALHGSALHGRRLAVEPAHARDRAGGRAAARATDDADEDRPPPPRKKQRHARASEIADPHKPARAALAGAVGMRTVLVRAAGAAADERSEPTESAVRRRIADADGSEQLQNALEDVLPAGATAGIRVVFKSWPDAGKAAAVLHGSGWDAAVEALASTNRCRVIVRNLPFEVSMREVRETFSAAGPLRNIHIPPPAEKAGTAKWRAIREARAAAREQRKLDRKVAGSADASRTGDGGQDDHGEDAAKPLIDYTKENLKHPTAGFAFVEYFLVAHANLAVAKVNGSKIGGRVVAVDRAVSKRAYESHGGDGDGVEDENPSKKLKTGEDGDIAKRVAVRTDPNDDAEDEGSERESADSEDSSDIEDVGVDEDGSGNCEAKGSSIASSKARREARSTPEELMRTVFIRNLLFETSAADLQKVLSSYGAIEQCVLVVHPVSGRPRGTAFVRFKHAESAKLAVAAGGSRPMSKDTKKDQGEEGGVFIRPSNPALLAASSGEGIVVDGRPLLITMAVDRSKARELTSESDPKAGKSDPRNLRLAWIGQIKANSAQAGGLSSIDIERRSQAEKAKRAKLTHNPNAFVSDVRLSVRNLPLDLDEKTLKHLFLCAIFSSRSKSKNGEGRISNKIITHVKIVRDEERNGRSKGYGFVLFERHEDALLGLQKLNNNPSGIEFLIRAAPKALAIDNERARLLRKSWGDGRRLMVEFAVEDHRQVRIIEQVKSRGRAKSAALASGASSIRKGAPDRSSYDVAKPAGSKKLSVKSRKKAGHDTVEPAVPRDLSNTCESVDGKQVMKCASASQNSTERRQHSLSSSKLRLTSQKRPRNHAKPRKGHAGEQKFEALVESYKRKVATSVLSTTPRWFD